MCLEEIRIWICMPTVYVSTLSNLFCPILADGVTVAARACQPFDCTDFEKCVSPLSVKQITLWFLRETYLVQHRRISIMRTSMLMYETTKPVFAHTDFPSLNLHRLWFSYVLSWRKMYCAASMVGSFVWFVHKSLVYNLSRESLWHIYPSMILH